VFRFNGQEELTAPGVLPHLRLKAHAAEEPEPVGTREEPEHVPVVGDPHRVVHVAHR
jgi:hypothetical protein